MNAAKAPAVANRPTAAVAAAILYRLFTFVMEIPVGLVVAAGWGIGRHVYDVDGLGAVALTAWHQDQVTEVPAGAEVVASSAFCPAAALRYGDRALTLQAHPEFGHDVTEAFLGLVAGDPAYPGALLDQARDGLARPLDTTPVVDWLADFLSAAAAAETRSRRHG